MLLKSGFLHIPFPAEPRSLGVRVWRRDDTHGWKQINTKALRSNSADCVMSAPLERNRRGYEVPAQIWLEPTPEEYIAQVKRVDSSGQHAIGTSNGRSLLHSALAVRK